MNPIIANLNRNNIVNQALSMRNPDALYQKMINDNPQFRKFVDENKGKTPQEIAQDELRHAMILHEMAVEMIERARSVMDPPEEMVDKWQNTHAEYVRCVDDVKSMLNIV